MKERKEPLLEECLAYFRERPVYEKIFVKIREKTVGLAEAESVGSQPIFFFALGGHPGGVF